MNILGDLRERQIGVDQEICRAEDALLVDIVLQTLPGLPLEELGEIARAAPGRGGYTEIPAPRIGGDMRYLPGDSERKIRVYHTMDVRLDLEDLYAKLQINFG